MRSLVMVIIGALVSGGVAHAQTADKGYAEVVAQSAFGNVTSQSYGVELGVTVAPQVQVFVEAGQTRNVATAALGTAAQAIAGGLALTQANVGFGVKEPVTFGAAGIRFLIPVEGSQVRPYLMGGAGLAKVKHDVTFTVGGTDVTTNLQQYGAVLGTDLSGSFTKPMLTLGAGIAYPVGRLVLDFQYRFGRIFAEDEAINVNRAGIGIGVRF